MWAWWLGRQPGGEEGLAGGRQTGTAQINSRGNRGRTEEGDERRRGICEGPPGWAKDQREGSSRSTGPHFSDLPQSGLLSLSQAYGRR